MRTAVDPRFPAELRRLRTQAGLSQDHLASQVATVKGHISDMEHGRRNPSRRMADNIDLALCAGGQLASLVSDGTTLNADDLDRLDYVSANPRHADRHVVASMRRTLKEHRELDDYVGSATVLPLAVAAQRIVQDLVVAAGGDIRDEVLDLGAQWFQFLGWLYTTSANWPMAKLHFGQALEWATERGDRDMVATVLSYQGHCHWLRGEYAPIVGLSHSARRDPTIYPGQLAYDGYQEARGLAVTGRLASAVSMLGEADELALANEAWTGHVPAWQYYRAPWFFALERGLVYRCMSRHDRRYAPLAVDELSAGLTGMPTEWQGAEWAGEYVAYLASALRTVGDIPEAKAAAERTRQIATATSSARVLAMAEAVEHGI
jgi:transcriptional regulator with XRE-family HTH domain